MKQKTTSTLAVTFFAVLASAACAWASPIAYDAVLSGPAESPPNASPGTGFAHVVFDLSLHSIEIQVTFSGLVGNTTASHIHAATTVPGTGTAGVATQTPYFTGFPIGVTSGSYDMVFDTSQASFYNPSYVSANSGSVPAAEAAFATSLANGTSYLNIHSNSFPSGEIRGFLAPVPEPSTIGLLTLGGAGLFCGVRRRLARR
jgi:hypothetical protein